MSASKTITFVLILCFTCALILAALATALRGPQERAQQLDMAKQILAAAHIEAPKGEVFQVFKESIKPMLTNAKGDLYTFDAAGIDYEDYIKENAKSGYSKLPNKLLYLVENDGGYIIPVNGFGLWGPIYGYIALEPNADTVIGVSWYAPAETPGLGAIIQDASWQTQFSGKQVFLPGIDLAQAPLGIIVVKGKVSDLFGDSPRAETAVDGITGATLTGDGVSAAYKDSLAPYRAFLLKEAK